MPGSLRARYLADHEAWVVWVDGDHDLDTAGELAETLYGVIHRRGRVVVDLTAATFIDSSIVNVLVASQAESQQMDASLRVVLGPDSAPRRTADFLGLPPSVAGYASLADALALPDDSPIPSTKIVWQPRTATRELRNGPAD